MLKDHARAVVDSPTLELVVLRANATRYSPGCILILTGTETGLMADTERLVFPALLLAQVNELVTEPADSRLTPVVDPAVLVLTKV
jgi:hypothetical protein